MIKIDFTQEQINALKYERYNHPHPKVQKKMDVLYLKSQKLKHSEICKICNISRPILAKYLKTYEKEGVEGLKQINYKGQLSELNKYAPTLEQYFNENPPRTVNEAQAKIEELTGIKRSPTQIREFMKRIGLKRRKIGYIPGKATEPKKIEEQEEFKTKELEPRLREAKEGKRVVFFTDVAHFVFGVFLGYVWSLFRLFIPSPSGRKRFNVLGAINAVTKEIITVTNETYINAESVCQLLQKIALLNIKVPVTLILDNARYQKCQLVQDMARALDIELLYLPSYSPNLNLIERFWRFVKKECLYSKYYSNFDDFKTAINDCINNANTDHKNKLDSLLSWNFQTFKNVNLLPV
jgi:transposase